MCLVEWEEGVREGQRVMRDHSKYAALRATSVDLPTSSAVAALECKPPPAPACSNPALRRSHGLQTRAGVRTVPPPTGALDSDRTHRHPEDAPRLQPTFAALAHALRRDGLDTVVFLGTSGEDLTSRRHPPRPWSHTGLRRLFPPLALAVLSPQTGSSRFHEAHPMPCRTSLQCQKTSPLFSCSYIFQNSRRTVPSVVTHTTRVFCCRASRGSKTQRPPPHAEKRVSRRRRRCSFRACRSRADPLGRGRPLRLLRARHSSWYLHWRSTPRHAPPRRHPQPPPPKPNERRSCTTPDGHGVPLCPSPPRSLEAESHQRKLCFAACRQQAWTPSEYGDA